MSDEVFVVSPEELGAGRFIPPEMVRDFQTVAAIGKAAIDGLAQALKQETGVLTKERVEHLTQNFLEDDATAESVVRTIWNIRPESKQKFLVLIDRWRQFSDDAKQSLPDDKFKALQLNLDSLVQAYPGLELMRKGQRLLRDTGNELEEAVFICDLRPVFDKPRERVEGFVTLAILRVRYLRQNGERDVFEIALTEDEVSMLVEQGQKALRKLNVLKETVHDLIQ